MVIVIFGARALSGLSFDVEREGDPPRERERPDPNADRERDVGAPVEMDYRCSKRRATVRAGLLRVVVTRM